MSRQKFDELTEKVSSTDIVEALCSTTTAGEVKAVWSNFITNNGDICNDIHAWTNNYDGKCIFESGTYISNPIAVAVVIAIIGDYNISEFELFANESDLPSAIRKEYPTLCFAQALADALDTIYLCMMSAEDIFPN